MPADQVLRIATSLASALDGVVIVCVRISPPHAVSYEAVNNPWAPVSITAAAPAAFDFGNRGALQSQPKPRSYT
jgi:hypothetical protein